MVRLFIGGLPAQVTLKDLLGRFAPFGKVTGGEIPASKATTSDSLQDSRGFAYVDFEPRDSTALHRCLSAYNGCSWSGSKLRVELQAQR
ncbi:hypothetical protein WJX73_001174 [Symbiochloris irregularis]|uniref:RRM domain-containing protein n=1 Tax=Symbiochloris irregularis TaxID=706552 RepID=A0AAW1NZ21_9CHLO